MADKFGPPGPDDLDRQFAAASVSRLLPRLWTEAFGSEYPAELRVFSPTTWTDLRRIDQAVALRPGHVLLDLGCGEGGPGLWLAARAGARLIGVDFSPYAIQAAQHRAGELVPDGQARFALGTFTVTRLPDAAADAAVSCYAFIFCTDKPAGLAELRRVLRPGGRFALLVDEVIDAAEADGVMRVADYRPLVTDAGLRTLTHEARTSVLEPVRRLYGLWLEHADELRAELGDEVAGMLVDEATQVGPRLDGIRPLLLVGQLCRPGVRWRPWIKKNASPCSLTTRTWRSGRATTSAAWRSTSARSLMRWQSADGWWCVGRTRTGRSSTRTAGC